MRTIFYILLSVFITASCNVCDSGGSNNSYKPNEIYFSAKTINSTNSSTFGVSADGSNLIEVLSNSLIFSSPSAKNSISYTYNQSSSKDIINYINLETNTDLKIVDEADFPKGIKSIISEDGNYFAFIVADSLFIYDVLSSSYQFVAEDIASNSIVSFSNDSKYLAYIAFSAGEYKLKVIDVSNLSVEQLSINFENNTSNALKNIAFYPVWMRDSKRVCIIDSKQSGAQFLLIANSETKETKSYNISNIGCISFGVALNSDKFVICANDGNLYSAEINDESYNTELVLRVAIDQACLYPKFSPDGTKLLYSRTYLNNINQFNSSLYVINLKDKKNNYLFSNVYMGFWY